MNRRPLLLAGAATLVLLLAWYFLLWSPRQDALSEAKARTEAARTRTEDLQARVNRLRALQRDETTLRAELDELKTAIPDLPNLGQFILDANDLAVRSGIDFISIAPTPPALATAAAPVATTTTTTAAGGRTTTTAVTSSSAAGSAPGGEAPAEIKMTFQISGGYVQILDFVNRLNDLPRLVVVDGLTIQSDPVGRLTVSMSARTFVQSSALTATTATGATATTTTTAPGGATTTTVAGATTTTSGARP